MRRRSPLDSLHAFAGGLPVLLRVWRRYRKRGGRLARFARHYHEAELSTQAGVDGGVFTAEIDTSEVGSHEGSEGGR